MVNFSDLPLYIGAGGGVSVSLLLYRILYLEKQILLKDKEIKRLRKRLDLIYLYLTKKDTNFGTFLSKHTDNF